MSWSSAARCAAFALALSLVGVLGCGEPLPLERREYAGVWRAEGVRLEIELAGVVHYKREQGTTKVEINAPIVEFQGDDFVVGLWLARTTFSVSEPPNFQGETWTMVVDGRRLTRVADAPDPSGSIRI